MRRREARSQLLQAVRRGTPAGTVTWVRLILGYGPDVTLRTCQGPTQPGGETALDYARRRRRPALVRLLEAARSAPCDGPDTRIRPEAPAD